MPPARLGRATFGLAYPIRFPWQAVWLLESGLYHHLAWRCPACSLWGVL